MSTNSLVVIALLSLTALTSGEEEDSHWCHNHVHLIDPLTEVRSYMNITTSLLAYDDLDELVDLVLDRVNCQQQESKFPNTTCEKCLQAENIYQVLDLEQSSSLSSEDFYKACTILVVTAHDLAESCSDPPDWEHATYGQFVERLMEIGDGHGETDGNHDNEDEDDDNEHDDIFTFEQLEFLLAEINRTYLAGEFLSGPDACMDPEQESFRSRVIIQNTNSGNNSDPALAGVEEQDVGEMSANIIARIIQGHCIDDDRAAIDGLPDETDFLSELFNEFGHDSCQFDKHSLEEIRELLYVVDPADEHDDHEDHDDDDHVIVKRAIVTSSHMRKRVKRDDDPDDHDEHDHDEGGSFLPDVGKQCLSTEDLLKTFYLDPENVSVSRDDFIRLCPALLQQSVHGCRYGDDHDDDDDEGPTNLEKYGYGTLAAVLVSVPSVLGLVIVKARNTNAYNYVMSLMLGLAFSSLTADALLHLIPHSLGLHDHDDDDHAHESEGIVIEPFILKMLAACGSVWLFFMVQMLLQICSNGQRHSHDFHTSITKEMDGAVTSERSARAYGNHAYNPDKAEFTDVGRGAHTHSTQQRSISFTGSDVLDNSKETVPPSVAWMVTFGDGLHNFADGLAIGASFAQNWQTGLSTSLAVLCHELPHEFGDTALLLSCGWSVKKVALFQVCSALTCFVGLYAGLAISDSSEARDWIFIVAAGMFLYIALSDVVPELLAMLTNANSKCGIFACSQIGALIGFGILLVIAIFEEDINIAI